MAFDPVASATTHIADHREPQFVHAADVAAAQRKLDEYRSRHGGRRPNILVVLMDDEEVAVYDRKEESSDSEDPSQ